MSPTEPNTFVKLGYLARASSKEMSPIRVQNRLALFAKNARYEAETLEPGIERDDLIRKARRADTAGHIDDWAYSPGLQPPN